MSAEPLRVLLVEDDEDDFVITSSLLAELDRPGVDLEWVTNYEDALLALRRSEHDLCLIDYCLGERTGLELLREAATVNPAAPMIMLTGHSGYEVDTQAMDAGAADYLIKGQISPPLLERSIRYALRRARLIDDLRQLASRDELTGLYNRRVMNDLLREEAERHQRYGRPAALVMLDVDHFKLINDCYGHLVGDEVLRWLAQLIHDTIRTVDAAARYGGEELAIILREMDGRQALRVAERVRHRVAASPFIYQRHDGPPLRVPVTVSLGVAGMPEDGVSAAALIATADQSLYAAKRRGRNRAVRFRDLIEQPETIARPR